MTFWCLFIGLAIAAQSGRITARRRGFRLGRVVSGLIWGVSFMPIFFGFLFLIGALQYLQHFVHWGALRE
jgi:hypothetical protein